MRWSLASKIFCFFLPLTLVSLLFGYIVFRGLAAIEFNNVHTMHLKEFQLQLKNLETWQARLSTHRHPLNKKRFLSEVAKTKTLAGDLAGHHADLPSSLNQQMSNFATLADNFSRAYSELFARYQVDRSSLEKIFPILEQLKKEEAQHVNIQTKNPSRQIFHENQAHLITDLMSELLLLQTRTYQQRDISAFAGAEKEVSRLLLEINNPEVASLARKLITILEENYFNYLAIENREKFLKKTASYFFSTTDNTIKTLAERFNTKKTITIWVILAVMAAAVVLNLIFWLLSSRYFKKFISSQQQAIHSINQGNYDFQFGNVPNDEIGDLSRTMSTMADRLKESQEQLGRSEKKYRRLVENLDDAIWETDAENRFTFISAAAQKILGYEPEELLGKSPKELIHPDEPEQVKQVLARSLEEHLPFEKTITHQHKNGTAVIIEAYAQPTFQGENFAGFRGMARNVTEKKRLEEQLQQSQKMESIGRLAGGVAHDFNNILSAINGYAEMCLMQAPKDFSFRKEIETILESGRRAAKLVQQLLTFSRKQVVNPELLDINQELQALSQMLSRLVSEDIEIKTIPGENLWPVFADRSQLEQVVINLAVNAKDAMNGGGTLTIETKNITFDTGCTGGGHTIPAGEYILLSVSDTGHGMNKEVSEKIFEPFFTTKEQGKGTGLGLATVYGIIKQNNGEIIVYSEPDRGTTFKIYLPRTHEESPWKTVLQPQEMEHARRGSETILLVEDDQLVRSMLVEILSDLGYTLLEAENGEEAMLTSHRYHGKIDLLLTDVVMPKMGGPELARKLRKRLPDIKVLFMSGYTEESVAQQGGLAEGMLFLQKPVTPQRLSAELNKMFS